MMKDPAMNLQVKLIVYMQTSPKNALKHIKERGRPDEQNVSLKYLRALHDLNKLDD